MSARSGSARFRDSTRGLMIVLAVAAIVLGWLSWMFTPRFPVPVIVTYEGQPLEDGKIVFFPRNPAGQQFSGQTIEGRFTLPHAARGGGANAGIYDVVVTWPEGPAKYRSRTTSGLSVQVTPTNKNIAVDLK